MWKYFFLGLLVGWLVEWLIDWFYWRRRTDPIAAAGAASARGIEADRPGAGIAAQPLAGAVAGGGAEVAARAAMAAGPPGARVPVVPVAADGAAPGQGASAVAVGAHGRLETASAGHAWHPPAYRQEDLEAVVGIGPKVGAMLRNNGITTFAELAETPIAELERIVESTGEEPEGAGVETWAGQARLAAAQDWAGLARLQDELQSNEAAAAGTSAGAAAGMPSGGLPASGIRRGA